MALCSALTQKYIARRNMEDIKTKALERDAWMMATYRDYCNAMREIADLAHGHYSLVSKSIKAREGR